MGKPKHQPTENTEAVKGPFPCPMANFILGNQLQDGTSFKPLELVKKFDLKTEQIAQAQIKAALEDIGKHFESGTKGKAERIKNRAELYAAYKYSADIAWTQYWTKNARSCLGQRFVAEGADEFMENPTGVEHDMDENEKPSPVSESELGGETPSPESDAEKITQNASAVTTEHVVHQKPSAESDSENSKKRGADAANDSSKVKRYKSVNEPILTETFNRFVEAAKPTFDKMLVEVAKATFDKMMALGLEQTCQETDVLEVESVGEIPATPPTLLGFEKAVEAIHTTHLNKDSSTSLFWNIIDFRADGTLPMSDNPRGTALVERTDAIREVAVRMQKLVNLAQERLSESVESYFSAVEAVAVHLDPNLSIARLASLTKEGGANFILGNQLQDGTSFKPLELVKKFDLKTEQIAQAQIKAALEDIGKHFESGTKGKAERIKNRAELYAAYKYSADIAWTQYWTKNARSCLGQRFVAEGADEFMENPTGVEHDMDENEKPSPVSESELGGETPSPESDAEKITQNASAVTTEHVVHQKPSAESDSENSKKRGADAANDSSKVKRYKSVNEPILTETFNRFVEAAKPTFDKMLVEVAKATFDKMMALGLEQTCQETDVLEVESVGEIPATPPTLLGFEKAVEAIHTTHLNKDSSTSLFWNIIDFRADGTLPMSDNPRGTALVERTDAIREVAVRMQKLVNLAQERLSESVESYFSAVEAVAVHLDPNLSIARLASLTKEGGEAEYAKAIQDRGNDADETVLWYDNLKTTISKIEPTDPDTQWANFKWPIL
ncbi:hypothetical protein HK104_004785 [Borealophlyctis nickersoniae]|nr:hypothetical protein HK104_004785 [Borealophlyctis nickersoniae]